MQRKIQTADDKPFSDSFDGGDTTLERVRNLLVGMFIMRHLQNVSAHETPCGDTPFVRQPFQGTLFIIGQCNDVLFRHGDLSFLSAVYSRKVTPQNFCGGLLV